MAEASDDARITHERLAQPADWHVRDEICRTAIAELVNFHHRLLLAGRWGEDRTPSSDGERCQAGGHKDFTSRVNARYGREPGATIYAHVPDQYAPVY